MKALTRRQAARFAALGHEMRLEILRRLASHPDGLVVGELQEALNVPKSTLSHHLDGLFQENLIVQVREGRYLRCLLDERGLKETRDFFDAVLPRPKDR